MKTVIFIILSLFVLSGCSNDVSKKEQSSNKELHAERDNSIVLKDTDGNNIKIIPKENWFEFEGYENKVVIINFFATWCPPCKAEIPHLNNLKKKYKKDVKIISVLLEENKSNEEIKEFMEKNSIEFTITNSISNFKLAKEIGGVRSIPFMLIYDRNGDYSQHYTGAVPEEMIDIDIQRVL